MIGEDTPLFSEEFLSKTNVKTSPAEEGTKEEKTTEGQDVQKSQPPQDEGEKPQPQEGADTKPQEGEPVEGDPPKEEPTEQTEFNLETFNKFFETDFKEVDDVKGLFEKVDKYSDYDEKVNKLTEFENTLKDKDKEITKLRESLDPRSYFSSDDAFKAEMIRKQHPDKDPVIIEKVIKSDLNKQKDFDVLVDDFLMDNPTFGGDRTRAEKVLMKRYGIDPDESPEEWEQVTKDEIMVEASKAKKKFQQLSDEVEMPEVISPEEREQQKAEALDNLKKSWKEPLDRIAQYEKEVIKDSEGNVMLEFEIPESFRSEIRDYAEAMVTSGEFPVNEESLAFVEDNVRKLAVAEYLPKLLEVYGNQLQSEWQRQKDEEEGNTKPPNRDVAPDIKGDDNLPSARNIGGSSERPRVLG